ncbi:MAG: class I SAM-dependent methyltransferase [Polyangiaceae bacterium]
MKRDFDAAAATWDANDVRVRVSLAIANAMLERLNFKGNESLLDYGAGTGAVALSVASHVKRVIAADSSKGMLDVLTEKASAAKVTNVTTLLLDLERQPPPGNAVGLDVIVSAMALHHIRDTQSFLKKTHEMLASGGRIAIADLDTEAGDFHPDNTGVEHFGFDRAALGTLFTNAGFRAPEFDTAHVVTRPVADGTLKSFPIFLAIAEKP